MRHKHIKKATAEVHAEIGGETTVFMATGADTEGRVSIYNSLHPKGNGAPLHYHKIDDEIFYVISGQVEFVAAGETLVGNAGDMIIVGPRVPRKFQALADSHLVVVNAPGGPSERF